ncbi:MAG: hypothetical protein HQL03_04355 [Nitrospirae bacterium]|nr:hypothetical protein [Nitrospirota bacterium]MBF0592363.1 hypothetical protein [Nitrospirota bacterium]
MAEQEKIEGYKNEIMAKLREAGGKGVSKKGLGIKSKGKDRETDRSKALKDLEANKEVVNLNSTYAGKSTPTLYVLREFDVVDKVCESIRGVEGATAFQVELAFARLFNKKLQVKPYVVPATDSVPLAREQVLAAYEKVKERCGFSDVEIADLRDELSVTQGQLEAFLLQESRQGKAVLSQGDWSLSDDKTRSGAIRLFGKPHLLVRLEK